MPRENQGDWGDDPHQAIEFLQEARTCYDHLTQKLKSLKMAMDECRRNAHSSPADSDTFSPPKQNKTVELPISVRFLKQSIENEIHSFKDRGFKFVRKSGVSHKEKKQLMRLIKDLDYLLSDLDRATDRTLGKAQTAETPDDTEDEDPKADAKSVHSTAFSLPSIDKSMLMKMDGKYDDSQSMRSTLLPDDECSTMKSFALKSISRTTYRDDDARSLISSLKTPKIPAVPETPSQWSMPEPRDKVVPERDRRAHALPSLRVLKKEKTNFAFPPQARGRDTKETAFSLPRMNTNLAINGNGKIGRDNGIVWKPYARQKSNLGYPFGSGFGDPPPLPKRQGTQFHT